MKQTTGKDPQRYGDQEAKRRFEAALRGSREVGHKTMSSMTPKRAKRKGGAMKKRSTGT